MGERDANPAIYIVSGTPGAGKTTVSRLLARRFDKGVHIESDVLQTFILSGGLWPNEEPLDEAMRQLRLRTRNVAMLAVSFFAAGFTPVIDDVVIGSRLGDFQHDLQGYPVRFVLLTPRIEVVRERDANRTEKHVFDIWGHLDHEMREDTRKVGFWLDSSELTAEHAVDAILANTEAATLA